MALVHIQVLGRELKLTLGKVSQEDNQQSNETLVRSNHGGSFVTSHSWFGFGRQNEL